jgi:N-acetylneuraminic acid mutarotase
MKVQPAILHRISLGICVAMLAAWTTAAGAAGGTWSHAAPMSTPRSELQAITVAGRIYVIGGNVVGIRNGQTATLPTTGIAQVYDPSTDSWQDLPPAPFGATHNGIAELDGKIYIAGGFAARGHAEATDRFFVYDPATAKWQELPPLSSPRGAPALISLAGRIHIVGGRNGPSAMPNHEVYDPATRKWSSLARLPVARDHVGIAVVDGKIHVYGGRLTDDTSNTGLHDIYDPATDKWTSAAPMPVPVSSGAFAQYDGLLIYLGGECKPGQRTFDEVQAYDPKTDRWRLLSPIPVERHANAAAVAGNRLFMFGGATGCGANGIVADNLVLTLP